MIHATPVNLVSWLISHHKLSAQMYDGHVPSPVIWTLPHSWFSEARRPHSVDAAVLRTVYEAHTVQHTPSYDRVSTVGDALHPAANRDRWRERSDDITLPTIHPKQLVEVRKGSSFQRESNKIISQITLLSIDIFDNSRPDARPTVCMYRLNQ